jgi:hypothetical protein
MPNFICQPYLSAIPGADARGHQIIPGHEQAAASLWPSFFADKNTL